MLLIVYVLLAPDPYAAMPHIQLDSGSYYRDDTLALLALRSTDLNSLTLLPHLCPQVQQAANVS